MPHSITHGNACFTYFNKNWGNPGVLGGVREVDEDLRSDRSPFEAFVFNSGRGVASRDICGGFELLKRDDLARIAPGRHREPS